MLPAVDVPPPAIEGGDSDSLTLLARAEFGVVTRLLLFPALLRATVEFFLVVVPEDEPVTMPLSAMLDFFAARVEATGPVVGGPVWPEPRLRFLMTSVLRERGRTTPWSFRNKPQALQRGWPSGLRRHRGVV